MGDPDFAKIPVPQLIDKKYAEAWRATIDPAHASPSKDLQRPPFDTLDRVATARPVPRREPENTPHYSVVDAAGNAVSVTDELAKIADTNNTHELVTNLYKSYMGMFRTAIGK